MNSILALAGTLLLALVFSEAFRKLKMPRFAGQIIAGIAIGLAAVPLGLLGESQLESISFFAELGLIFLIFLVGLEIDISMLKRVSKNVFLLGLSGTVVPLAVGFFSLRFLGFGEGTALVAAAILAITSHATKAASLIESGHVKTRLGETMIGSAIIIDIAGVAFLGVVLAIHGNGGPFNLAGFLWGLAGTATIIFVAVKALNVFCIPRRGSDGPDEVPLFSSIVLVGLLVAFLTENLGLGAAIGAFVAGLFLQSPLREIGREKEALVEREFRTMALGFIVPFFFVNIGIIFAGHKFTSSVPLILAVLCIAVAGKMLAALLVKPWTGTTWKQSFVIGLGLNSRGAVELVIAQVALANGLIGAELFSAIVVVAIITTFGFPVLLERFAKRDPNLML